MTHSQSKAISLEKKAYFRGIFAKFFEGSAHKVASSAFEQVHIVWGYTIFIFSTFFTDG
jgi:hypothetical protein